MSSAVPVTVSNLGETKKGVGKKTRNNSSQYKFINRIDGLGQYMRFAFYAQTLEEANNLLCGLHSDKIIDNCYSHAYSRTRGGKPAYAVHGFAHLTSRDFDFKFLRTRLPHASLRVSFYPEATYPKKESVEVLQENSAPNCVQPASYPAAQLPLQNYQDGEFLTFMK